MSVLFPFFGYIGLFLACLTGFITMFLFRNHEFSENDALRRKYRSITFFVFICRVAVTFVYYQNIPSLVWFKELLMILITILMIADCIKYRPYNDEFVYKCYLGAVASFGVCMFLFSIFLEFTFILEHQLGYYIIMLSVVCSGGLIV